MVCYLFQGGEKDIHGAGGERGGSCGMCSGGRDRGGRYGQSWYVLAWDVTEESSNKEEMG